MALDRLAARRGDGLHPALRALLDERMRLAAGGVAVLDDHRAGPFSQAGPVPSGPVPDELPAGIVRFAGTPLHGQAGRRAPSFK